MEKHKSYGCHAEGGNNKIYGDKYSHIEGFSNTINTLKLYNNIDDPTTPEKDHLSGYGVESYENANLRANHVEGFGNTESGGEANHVTGRYNVIEGSAASFAGGTGNNIENSHESMVFGSDSKLTGGSENFVFGTGLIGEKRTNQFLIGKYNQSAAGAFIIGNGTSLTARSNAVIIDWEGNIFCNSITANSISGGEGGGEGGTIGGGSGIDKYIDLDSTTFEKSFRWSAAAYPGTTDPLIDECPVLVVALKNGAGADYKFINLVEIGNYSPKDTAGVALSISDAHEISARLVLSSADNNALVLREDGLYANPSANVTLSTAEGNVLETREDGLYANPTSKVAVSGEERNIIQNTESGLYANSVGRYSEWDETSEYFNFYSQRPAQESEIDNSTGNIAGMPGQKYYAHAEGCQTHARGMSSHSEGQNTKAYGHSSHAEGYSTTAKEYCTHAEGDHTTAAGSSSHAEGYSTTAGGHYSHAEGGSTTANGYYSHAEGSSTKAIGDITHAEGSSTTANGAYSHAEGGSTTTNGYYSHAEGCSTKTVENSAHAEGYSTTANGAYSHTEGGSTTASGYCDHAEGNYTSTTGGCSHAEGNSTTAGGYCAHAEGNSTIAGGYCTHAGGYDSGTNLYCGFVHGDGLTLNTEDLAGVRASAAFGYYNKPFEKALFMVGNGDRNSRSNAFAVDMDGVAYMNDIKLENFRLKEKIKDMESCLMTMMTEITEYPRLENSEFTYTGSEITPTLVYDENVFEANGDLSGLADGTYKIIFSLKPGYRNSDNTRTPYEIEWKINPVLINTYPSTVSELVYNGSSQAPIWNDYDSERLSIGGTTQGSSAYTYSTTFTPKTGYAWADGTKEPYKVEWKIAKANPFDISVTEAMFGDNSLLKIEVSEMLSGVSYSLTVLSDNEDVCAGEFTRSGTANNAAVTLRKGLVNGTAKITISYGGNTNMEPKSIDISVTNDTAEYVLGNCSPARIKEIIQSGNASKYWNIGDKKKIELNGTAGSLGDVSGTYYAKIIDFDHNTDVESGGAPNVHFMIDETTSNSRFAFAGAKANLSDTNAGGWEKSFLRTTCERFFEVMPEEWQAVISDTVKYTSNSASGAHYGTAPVTATTDKIFVMSEYEVRGSTSLSNNWEKSYQTKYPSATRNVGYMLLRSPYRSNNTQWVVVAYTSYYRSDASISRGMIPCFGIF